VKHLPPFFPELSIDGCFIKIFESGSPSIRGEVWEFLLGCYDPKSTFEEREQIRHHRRLQAPIHAMDYKPRLKEKQQNSNL